MLKRAITLALSAPLLAMSACNARQRGGNPEAGGAAPSSSSLLHAVAVPAASADGAHASGTVRYGAPSLSNRAPYLPAQCYATTAPAKGGRAHNGCYVCHQASREPNYVDDGDLQTTLSLPRYATENHWTNVLAPPPAAEIGDAELVAWVRTSNYFGRDRSLVLARKLASLPGAWDENGDGRFDGFVPDCWFSPDAAGFDRDASGKPTGWRAYASTPVPGMFFPTNGSLGDVFIRLPPPYRQDASGVWSEAVYRVNLAILEAYLRRTDVSIDRTDERPLGSDLDGNGALGFATRVAFVWPPRPNRPFHYVGKASELSPKQDGWPAAGLFPKGTELLHSVRYLDVEGGRVRMAARMKELRYLKKTRYYDYGRLQQAAGAEAREKRQSPDQLKHVFGNAEHGVATGTGWQMQAFVEDRDGELRPQTLEETTACIGCHGGVGATTDSTFSFVRKLDATAFQGGWFHPDQRDLAGVAEPKLADGQGEYAEYLAAVGGGDDFRANDEVRARFFRPDGTIIPAKLRALARDISLLVMPAPERALALDRAYLGLVSAQRFDRGRDVILGRAAINPRVEQDASTGIQTLVLSSWNRALPTASR